MNYFLQKLRIKVEKFIKLTLTILKTMRRFYSEKLPIDLRGA